ncbi:MAG: 30S ribosomal protein S15 [Saprospirales bacterium]|nr:30S ribosomal protein S15 [Saprospirales bacterium]
MIFVITNGLKLQNGSLFNKRKESRDLSRARGSENNTGSIEGQVALITFRIKSLSEHLKANNKDHSCRRSLLRLVAQRKKHLKYLERKDIQRYRAIIEKLGLRG